MEPLKGIDHLSSSFFTRMKLFTHTTIKLLQLFFLYFSTMYDTNTAMDMIITTSLNKHALSVSTLMLGERYQVKLSALSHFDKRWNN